VAPTGLDGGDGRRARRIAVGIDGGRGSAAALVTAARLAARDASRLRLIAVAEPEVDHGADPHADPRELARLSRHLDRAADDLPGSEVDAVLREGLADLVLVGDAADADLLVLGSRAEYGDAGHVVIGTVAARVLRHAPCPVLIVPSP
jgi:nucleotide-binding universal stress UspA family protein